MCVCDTVCVCVCVARKSPGRGRKSHDVGKCLMHTTSRKRNLGNDWQCTYNLHSNARTNTYTYI